MAGRRITWDYCRPFGKNNLAIRHRLRAVTRQTAALTKRYRFSKRRQVLRIEGNGPGLISVCQRRNGEDWTMRAPQHALGGASA